MRPDLIESARRSIALGRRLIIKDGWTRGTLQDPLTGRRCIGGALLGVENRMGFPKYLEPWEGASQDITIDFIDEAIRSTLTAAGKQELNNLPPWQFMVQWNNSVAKSTWDVVAALSRAENLAVKELEKQNG